MNSAKSNRRAGAFTLVEMLVVIAIIGLLAALLLPALSGSQRRAQRIVCESQLRQMGLAFQIFAHDHNGKFPMQVSTNHGGSLEFAQGGYLVNGPFYFGFRHFQPLAGLLETPKLLVCPADTRLAATNFATLQNSNLSYFVSVSADAGEPMSLLAGDGNLTATATLLRGAAGGRLTWTGQQHQFKGNVLFADGHVEEWSDGSAGTLVRGGDFVLPSLNDGNQPLPAAATRPFSDTKLAAPSAGPARQADLPADPAGRLPTNPSASLSAPASGGDESRTLVAAPTQTEFSNPAAATVPPAADAPGDKLASPQSHDALMSPLDHQIADVLREFLVGTYLLILLLLLLVAAYRVWRWRQQAERQRHR